MLRPILKPLFLLPLIPLAANAAGYIITALLAIIAMAFLLIHVLSEMAILALDPRLRRAAADM